MADNSATDASSRLPLDTFTRSTPPGWTVNIQRYPIRRYAQLLKLWWLQTDLPEHQWGPAIAGRLKGSVFQYAMSLKQERFDPATGQSRVVEAPELFAEAEVEAILNPQTGAVIMAAQDSGAKILVTAILREFTSDRQDLQWEVLTAFFELYRGNASFSDTWRSSTWR